MRPRPVELPRLPSRGFVVGGLDGVTFRNETGEILLELDDLTLVGNHGAPGVWFRVSRRTYFRLDVIGHRLIPVGRVEAMARMYEEGPEPELRPPPGQRVHGRVAGHWRYVIPSPVGDVVLAQWSGECEHPSVYWLEGDEGPRLVIDPPEVDVATDSIALGWSRDGLAYIHAREGYCGGPGNPPGVYAYERPLSGSLIFETGPRESVAMWMTT
ncbi:MAG: hypothetical protein ACRDKT_18120 [Actinomycetota bacterium]